MKVLYDTCLYIDLIRSSKYLDLFQNRLHIRFLSPIVVLELRAGATTTFQKRIVDRLITPYSKAYRIIELHPNLYYKAGACLAKLNPEIVCKRGFTHDLLIAFSAISIGATLFTNNRKDFEKISKLLPLKWEFIECTPSK